MFLLIGMSIVPATGDTALEKQELSKNRSYLRRVLRVPSAYPTIQSGIDNASNGDMVLVAPGTYRGDGNRDLDFHGKAITVASEQGAEVTIIDCNASSSDRHRGFIFHSGEDASSVVNGFTITSGYYDSGGGIYCIGSSPTITNCIMTDNTAVHDGGGIYCYSYSSPTINNNSIIGNSVNGIDGSGGGISCYDYSNPMITNNNISGNWAFSLGGGVFCVRSSPTISNNTISYNSVDNWGGGGIWCHWYCYPIISGNIISGNSAKVGGGGIGCWDYVSPIIINNIICFNSVYEVGGGIDIHYYCNPTVSNNVISDNYAYIWGGGISCEWTCSPTINNNIIIDNSVRWDGGGISCDYDCSPIITNNLISGNNAGDWGGGINFDNYFGTMKGNNALRVNSACYPSSCNNLTTCKNTIRGNYGYSGTEYNPRVSGNTITGNSADEGGGIYCRESNPAVTNTILWGNTANYGPEIYHSSGNLAVTYCDVEGGWLGEGNIDADPLFVLPDKKDYRLLWGSPCIDSGKPDWSDPDGTRSDMGAHYFNQNDYLTLYLSPHDTSVAPGYKLGVTYTLINRYNESRSFYILSKAALPDGQVFNVLGPVQKRLPGSYTVQREIPLKIPMGAPFELEVLYQSHIGLPPNTLFDEDSFSFTIDHPPYEPHHPSPSNGSIDVDVDTDLGWISSDPDPFDTVTYDVYLGTSIPPPQVAWNQSSTSYDPGTMNYNTTYYWRVVAWDNHGASTSGPLWFFKTGVAPFLVWVDDDFNESTPGWGVTCFDNIQNGIAAVAYHGRVYVYNGTYYEHVVVDKTIDLVGENKDSTVVDGSGDGNVVHINAGWVNISGFTIRNSGNDPYGNGGIYVRSDYNTIFGNNVEDNDFGIWLKYPTDNKITGNTIINNLWGILLEESSNFNIISGNTIKNNTKDGIYLRYSCYNNIISENNITNNRDNGIQLYGTCDDNIISGNNITDNDDGIYLGAWSDSNIISGNNITENNYGIRIRYSPVNNIIYHNNFINNIINAYDDCTNIWNLSYPSGGSYWSDYTGDDNYHGPGQNLSGPDGIGDTPYNISGKTPPNQDVYPFMNQNGWLLGKIRK